MDVKPHDPTCGGGEPPMLEQVRLTGFPSVAAGLPGVIRGADGFSSTVKLKIQNGLIRQYWLQALVTDIKSCLKAKSYLLSTSGFRRDKKIKFRQDTLYYSSVTPETLRQKTGSSL